MRNNITAIEIIWRSPWVRAFTYVFGSIFLAFSLWQLRDGYAFALQVAIISFVIAYVLNPVVELLEHIRVRRAFAVVLIYIALLMLIIAGSVILSQVAVQTGQFARLIPDAIDNIIPFLEGIADWFDGMVNTLPPFLLERFSEQVPDTEMDSGLEIARQTLESFLEDFANSLNSNMRTIVSSGGTVVLTGVTNILSTTFQVFLILLASAYFLYDYPKITASFRRYVPVRNRPLYDDLLAKADRAIGGYMRGQLLIAMLLGIMVWVGLTLIGLPLALAISVIATIFNLIPYLGPIIATIPAVLLGFTVSPLTALWAVLIFVIANQFEGNVLSPFILSKSTNLHPVTVLLSILAGAGMLGLVGALLAVPVVAMTKVVLEEYLLRRPAYHEPEEEADSDAETPESPNIDPEHSDSDAEASEDLAKTTKTKATHDKSPISERAPS